MKINMSMEKINNYLLNLCFFLIMLSISITLIDVKIARVSFFVACYISVFGVLIDKKNYKKFVKILPIPLLILGLSKIIWFYYFYNNAPDINLNTNYIQAGKRIIFCSIIIAYLLANLRNTNLNKKIIVFSVILSFIFSTIFAIYQIKIGLPRVELNTQATGAAYMYSCITLLLISYCLISAKKTISYIILSIIFLISFFIIIQTGTRTAIIFHPILFLILVFYASGRKVRLILSLSSIMITIAVGLFFKTEIIEKINTTNNEIAIYENSRGNEGSSLGARFSMWNAGMYSFYQSPMGASLEQRYSQMKSYTEKENKDRAALIFANIHLHNEIVDTLSLQGILGAIIVIFFYISMLVKSFREKNPMLLSVILCLIAYGLTEVIFVSREMSILFSLMILSALLLNRKEKIEE
ncbi:ligase [Pragia fontium]|uniref:O-antigen ligase n=3 Tax=Pragia fontium TaxID=82985 RepID=A0AAJ5BI65_9GAMM|nr:O-antigen ligase family protein [Pragia fontium]GKX64245.1 ligase [Pragia fontium]SFD22621.1 O-antigen ligase [Pragia fontium DSM 5563 = ATCC 49100]VEJ56934.1 O-antigen ligase [Pragia fontium]